MAKKNKIPLTLHDRALEALGGQPKGLYWLALKNSITDTPINITNGLELTPGQLFKAQKDIRSPLARRRTIYATWQPRGGCLRARYGNVNPR